MRGHSLLLVNSTAAAAAYTATAIAAASRPLHIRSPLVFQLIIHLLTEAGSHGLEVGRGVISNHRLSVGPSFPLSGCFCRLGSCA